MTFRTRVYKGIFNFQIKISSAVVSLLPCGLSIETVLDQIKGMMLFSPKLEVYPLFKVDI